MGDSFEIHFAPTHEEASRVRQETRQLLDVAGVSAGEAGDVELIVAELLSNAVDQEPGEPVWLEVVLSEDSIYVTVANRSVVDRSLEPTPSQRTVDDLLADRGRGLLIIETLADGMWVHPDGDWTAVSCVKRLDQQSPS